MAVFIVAIYIVVVIFPVSGTSVIGRVNINAIYFACVQVFQNLQSVVVICFDQGMPQSAIRCIAHLSQRLQAGINRITQFCCGDQILHCKLYCFLAVFRQAGCNTVLNFQDGIGFIGLATLVDTMVNDALWDAFNNYHMIQTADNICDEWKITREELDEFALKSQQKAEAAQNSGAFDKEIVPVMVKKKKEMVEFKVDEGPRHGSTIEALAKLRPINKDKYVTAGNASGINDGAAAIVVMTEEKAKELGVTPMAEWVAGALAGVRPEVMGIGPVASTKKVMAKTGMKIEDFDIIEANEAFAAQSIAVGRDLGIDVEKQLNPNGGAIALGHPVGASGCRILVTLLHEMEAKNAKTGLATLCIGGGMGCSTIVKKYEA